MLHISILDLFVGDCELTQKTDVEVVRLRLDEGRPESVIATSELLRFLRFTKKQTEKSAAGPSPCPEGKVKPSPLFINSKGEIQP